MAGLSRRLGFTMRARLFLAFLATGMAPHAGVFAFSQIEKPAFVRLQTTTQAATDEARAAAGAADRDAALRAIARRHQVRVRLYDRQGELALDVDEDREPVGMLHKAERLLVTTATPGELRDAETMRTALQAADTGHTVYSTMHTTNAPQTVQRQATRRPETKPKM